MSEWLDALVRDTQRSMAIRIGTDFEIPQAQPGSYRNSLASVIGETQRFIGSGPFFLSRLFVIQPGNCKDFSSWKRMEHDKQFIAEAIPR